MSLKRLMPYYHKLFAIILLTLSVIASGCIQNKSNQSGNQAASSRVEESPTQQHEVSGIKIGDQSFQLLEEVESLYGRPVKVEQTSYNDQYYGGGSTVSDDGMPGISLNNRGLGKETALVHELFHLKLRFEGFPAVYAPASAPNDKLSENTLSLVRNLSQNVNEVILHTIFFLEMKKMGLNPSSSFNTFLRLSLEKGEVDRTSEFVPRTFLYYTALMECDDLDLIAKLEERFRNNRWDDSIAVGRRLAQQTKAAPPQTPVDLVNTAVALMNALMNGRGNFRFVQWGQDVKKGKLTERTPVILVEAPGNQ